jgi:hypothetical protein
MVTLLLEGAFLYLAAIAVRTSPVKLARDEA